MEPLEIANELIAGAERARLAGDAVASLEMALVAAQYLQLARLLPSPPAVTLWMEGEMEGGRRPGRIWWEAWVDCGLCEHMWPLGSKGRQEAIEAGWRQSRKHGWLCPECQSRRTTGEDHG
jgi:hypothetical protein